LPTPVYRITEHKNIKLVFITLVILRRRLVRADNPFHPFVFNSLIYDKTPVAPETLLKLRKCNCKTGCKRQSCGCKKNQLVCTDLCGCREICENIIWTNL